MPSLLGSWRSLEGMRRLWISVELFCRRRIGEEDGRTRLGMGKRLDVCGVGRVLRLVSGFVVKSVCQTSIKVQPDLPSTSTACPEAREQSAPVESIKNT